MTRDVAMAIDAAEQRPFDQSRRRDPVVERLEDAELAAGGNSDRRAKPFLIRLAALNMQKHAVAGALDVGDRQRDDFRAAARKLVALAIADIERTGDGVFLHIARGKTDQEGLGASIAIPTGGKLGVLEALDDWIAAAGLSEGPLFRAINRHGHVAGHGLSDDVVALVIKRAAKAARLDPSAFSGHSLRSGFVTSALASGADLFRIMDVTRHREVKTLRIYDRRAKAFNSHPGRKFL